jgi:hypothetical protein
LSFFFPGLEASGVQDARDAGRACWEEDSPEEAKWLADAGTSQGVGGEKSGCMGDVIGPKYCLVAKHNCWYLLVICELTYWHIVYFWSTTWDDKCWHGWVRVTAKLPNIRRS